MLFDRSPHTAESIIRPDGRIVIPGSKMPNLIAAMILSSVGIQIPIVCLTLDLGSWGLLGLLALPLAALAFLIKLETRIDPTAGTLSRLWGIGEPTYSLGTTNLAKYDAVTFGWYMVSSKNGSYRVDCVGLRDRETGESRQLTKVKDENESRSYGEAIAKTLRLPLQRLGSDELRAADELDTKLADRVVEGDLPTAPEEMRSELRHEGDQFIIEISGPDPQGVGMQAVRNFGRICGVLGVGFLALMAVGAKLDLLAAVVVVAVGALVGSCLYRFVVTNTLKEMEQQAARIVLASNQLIIWERDLQRNETTTTLPYDELEEFYHDKKRQSAETPEWLRAFTNSSTKLVASSDPATKEFAAWISWDEKEYIVALVRQLLVRMNQSERNLDIEEQAPVPVGADSELVAG